GGRARCEASVKLPAGPYVRREALQVYHTGVPGLTSACVEAVSLDYLVSVGDQALHRLPYIVHCDGLHTGAVNAGLHLAQEKTGLSGRVTPERDMPRIIQWIGSIL